MKDIWTVVCFYLVIAATRAQRCDDIDTTACQLMFSSRPDLCFDQTIAKTACPRFCKLCPVECYHCNTTVPDYLLCNTTLVCQNGEVCMRKEVKSFADGFHLYEMKCGAKELCDGGPDMSFAIGKRHLDSRDISVTCCAADFCNYPTTPTISTTAGECYKDIIFMVDQSEQLQASGYSAAISVIKEVVKRLEIGIFENLVALFGFDQRMHDRIALLKHTDKQSLLADLQQQQQQHPLADHFSDVQHAVDIITHQVLTQSAGDRPSYPDAVVIILDSTTAQHVHILLSQRDDIVRASKDVIILSLGQSLSSPVPDNVDTLATDQNHILHVPNLQSLDIIIVNKIVAMLQQC